MTDWFDNLGKRANAYRAVVLAVALTIGGIVGGGVLGLEYLDARYLLASDAVVLKKLILQSRELQLDAEIRRLRQEKYKLEQKEVPMTLQERGKLDEIQDDLEVQELIRDSTQMQLRSLH